MDNKENLNIDNKNEVVGAKNDRISSARIFESTIRLIENLNLEGKNKQEQLDYLAKEYKRLSDEAQNKAKEDINKLDLSSEFDSLIKKIEIFKNSIEDKTNEYIDSSVKVAVSNSVKDFEVMHEVFEKQVEDVRSVAVASQEVLNEKDRELNEKNKEIDSLNLTIEELNRRISEIKESRDNLVDYSSNLEDKYKKLENRNTTLEESIVATNAKLETEKSLKNSEIDKANRLRNNITDLEKEVEFYRDKISLKDAEVRTVMDKNGKLQARNEELEVQNTHFAKQNALLEEENKTLEDIRNNVAEKREEVAQLTKKAGMLENELKEFNLLKVENAELKGTIKALEAQSNTLETTLNVIQSTVSIMTEAKVKAEERAISLEGENSRLLKEIEELKKQFNIKK